MSAPVTVLLADATKLASTLPEAAWIEYMRAELDPDDDTPELSDDGLGYLLWNHTAWPFGTVGYIRVQIAELAIVPRQDAHP